MWIKRNTLERKLADAMGYEYCTLFDTARSALENFELDEIPSNICLEIGRLFPCAWRTPVSPKNGLPEWHAWHLYGFRGTDRPVDKTRIHVSVDPLMTGFLRESNAQHVVISFGRKKMLDAGGGGALLSNERQNFRSNFPEALRSHLEWKLTNFRDHIELTRDRIDLWDAYLGDSCVRIPQEQIMPWRAMRRIPRKRDAAVKAVRAAGHPVGTNYPPLPGVTDLGAIQ